MTAEKNNKRTNKKRKLDTNAVRSNQHV